jgi:hypothetical protein
MSRRKAERFQLKWIQEKIRPNSERAGTRRYGLLCRKHVLQVMSTQYRLQSAHLNKRLGSPVSGTFEPLEGKDGEVKTVTVRVTYCDIHTKHSIWIENILRYIIRVEHCESFFQDDFVVPENKLSAFQSDLEDIGFRCFIRISKQQPKRSICDILFDFLSCLAS